MQASSESSPSPISDLPSLRDVLHDSGRQGISRDARDLFAQEARILRLEDDSLLVFRHDDLRRLGANTDVTGVSLESWLQRSFIDRVPFEVRPDELGEVRTFFANVITNLRMEAHEVMKPLFSRAVTPKAMQEFAPVMERLARIKAAELSSAGPIELLGDFHVPLGVDFWAEILSLTPAEKASLAASLAGVHMAAGSRIHSRAELSESNRGLADYFSIVGTAMNRARAMGGCTFVDTLVDRYEALEELPEGMPETLELCIAASMSDGFGTMALGAANCAAALLANPSALALVRSEPGLIANAVFEGLRLYPPLNLFYRQVRADVHLDDLLLPAGTSLSMLWGAGNYDPAVYDRPAEYDVRRTQKPLMTFGTGNQLCPGRNLANMMAGIVLKVLTGPNFAVELTGEVEWTETTPLTTLNTTISFPVCIRAL